MKILFLSEFCPPDVIGGSEISMYILAKELAKQKNEVTILTRGKIEKVIFQDNIKILKIKELLIPKKIGIIFEEFFINKASKKIQKDINLNNFDIIHAHDMRTSLILAKLNLDNSMITVRDCWPICMGRDYLTKNGECKGCSFLNFRKCLKYRKWFFLYPIIISSLRKRKKAFHSIKNKIFISHFIKSKIKSDGEVIYNPIDSRWINSKLEKKSFKGPLKCVYVGSIKESKGINLLIDTFNKLYKKRFKLDLIGEGNIDKFKERVTNDNIRFLGRIPNNKLKKKYREYSLLCHFPKLGEGFGRTIIEAMSQGVLVLTRDYGGPTEIVNDGETGFVLKQYNVNSFIKKLNFILNSKDKNKIRDMAFKKIKKEYNPRKIAKQYINYYKNKLIK